MDIAAHALWAGIGVVALSRRRPINRATLAFTVAAAVLPDVLQLLPVVGWWLFADGTWAALSSFVVAVPGQEPGLPPAVQRWSHELHCVMHSAPVAALVTAIVWAARRSIWLPLLGWWSHIVIDVFTHSADYYAVPVLYPFTERGFDGIAWTTPWFLALNYLAIGAAAWWLWRSRQARGDDALRP